MNVTSSTLATLAATTSTVVTTAITAGSAVTSPQTFTISVTNGTATDLWWNTTLRSTVLGKTAWSYYDSSSTAYTVSTTTTTNAVSIGAQTITDGGCLAMHNWWAAMKSGAIAQSILTGLITFSFF